MTDPFIRAREKGHCETESLLVRLDTLFLSEILPSCGPNA
jgi:hypothetical protein